MCALSEGSQIKTNPFLSVRFAINLISLFIENQGDGGRILIRPTKISFSIHLHVGSKIYVYTISHEESNYNSNSV